MEADQKLLKKLEVYPSMFEVIKETGKFKKKYLKVKLDQSLRDLDALGTKMEKCRTNNFISFIYFLIGDEKLAYEYGDKTLELDPDNIIAISNQSRFLLEQEQNYDTIERNCARLHELCADQYKMVIAKAEIAFSYTRVGTKSCKIAQQEFRNVIAECNRLTDVPVEFKNNVCIWTFGLTLTYKRLLNISNVHSLEDIDRSKQNYTSLCKLYKDIIAKESVSPICKNYAAKAYVQLGEIAYDLSKSGLGFQLNDILPDETHLHMRVRDEYFDKALSLQPDDVFVLERCGKFFRYFNQLSKSKELFQKAIRIKPTCFSHHHLALTLKRQLESNHGQRNQTGSTYRQRNTRQRGRNMVPNTRNGGTSRSSHQDDRYANLPLQTDEDISHQLENISINDHSESHADSGFEQRQVSFQCHGDYSNLYRQQNHDRHYNSRGRFHRQENSSFHDRHHRDSHYDSGFEQEQDPSYHRSGAMGYTNVSHNIHSNWNNRQFEGKQNTDYETKYDQSNERASSGYFQPGYRPNLGARANVSSSYYTDNQRSNTRDARYFSRSQSSNNRRTGRVTRSQSSNNRGTGRFTRGQSSNNHGAGRFTRGQSSNNHGAGRFTRGQSSNNHGAGQLSRDQYQSGREQSAYRRCIKSPGKLKVIELSENEEAIQLIEYHYDKSIELGMNTSALYDKGLLFRQTNRTKDALTIFRRLIRNEDGLVSLTNLARSYEQAGRCLYEILDNGQSEDQRRDEEDMKMYYKKSIEISCNIVAKIPSLEKCWTAAPTLMSFLRGQSRTKHVLKDLKFLYEKIKDFGNAVLILDELMHLVDSDAEKVDVVEDKIRNHVQTKNYDDAVLAFDIIKCLPKWIDRVDKSLYTTVNIEGAFDAYTKKHAGVATLRFRNAFNICRMLSNSTKVSDDADDADETNDEDDDNRNYDICILCNPEHPTNGIKLQKLLEALGIRTSVNTEDVQLGALLLSGLSDIMNRSSHFIVIHDVDQACSGAYGKFKYYFSLMTQTLITRNHGNFVMVVPPEFQNAKIETMFSINARGKFEFDFADDELVLDCDKLTPLLTNLALKSEQ